MDFENHDEIEEMKLLFEHADYLDANIEDLVNYHFRNVVNLYLDIRDHYKISRVGHAEMVSHSTQRNFTYLGVKKEGQDKDMGCIILVNYAGLQYKTFRSETWQDILS